MNGYEIRLEVLKMAKDLLLDQFNNEWQHARDEWQQKYYLFTNTDTHGTKFGPSPGPFPDMPKFPTINDIINKTQELYKFVQLN